MRSSHSILTTATSAPLPVASAIAQVKQAIAGERLVLACSISRCICSSASSIAAICGFFADLAASAAHSASIT